MAKNPSANPFMVNICGQVCQTCDCEGRIRMVQNFNRAECHAALKLACLQKTVKKALERRLRKLEKMAVGEIDGGLLDGTNRTTSGWIGQP